TVQVICCQPRFCPARLARLIRFLPYLRGRPRLRRRPGRKMGGRSRSAASLRSRPTTTTPAAKARLKNGNLVYPPSTTTHSVLPACFTSLTSHSKRSAACSSLVWNFHFRFLGIVGNVLRR